MTLNYKNYHDFIYYALRDRFETCKKRERASDEEDDIFDSFAEMVAECWVREGDTPSSIVDNRCINWTSGTYRDFLEDRTREDPEFDEIREKEDEERSEEDLEKIEERIQYEGGDFDRSSFYFHI